MNATSTIADDGQIGPGTHSPLRKRTLESSGKEKIVEIAPSQTCSGPIVKPRRKRVREKIIWSKDPSELEKLDPKWLDLPGVEVEGKIGEIKGRIVVQAHAVFDPNPPCTRCHSNRCVTKWSFRDQPRNIKDAERNTRLVLIVLIVQRYFCDSCEKPFTPLLSFPADGHLNRTERLSKRASALTFERRTSTDIAALTGLSRRTEQDIARKTAETLPTPQQVFQEVTADGKGHIVHVDNCHPSSGECTSILLDAKPFELLPKYNEAAITAFFMSLGVEGRNNVTCYISDLAEILLRPGRKCFPCATIVADPHHVVRLLLERFDEFLKPFQDSMLAEYISAIDDQRIVRPARPKKGKRKKKIRPEQDISETSNKEEEKTTRRPTAAEIRILLHTKIGGRTRHKKRL